MQIVPIVQPALAQTAVAPAPTILPVGYDQTLIHSTMRKYWPEKEWIALRQLVLSESGFNPYAVNKYSGACGYFQANGCQKQLAVIGSLDNKVGQAEWGMDYIKKRYTTPTNALHFWLYEAVKYDFDKDGKPDNKHWY